MNVDSDREGIDGVSEMDSHADTTAAGSNMVMLDDPDDVMHFVDVSPFSDDYAPIKKVPIAQCATAWTDPDSGVVWILVFNEALYFGDKLKNSLTNPNQIRSHAFNKVIPQDNLTQNQITVSLLFWMWMTRPCLSRCKCMT